jgi:Ca2+/Na+ antiporter
LLVIIGGLVAVLGPGWGLFWRREALGAGRWAGIALLVAFAVYVGGIVYGIQKGNIIAPEGSDSDSDTSDEGTSESEDEDEPSEESGYRRGIPILTSIAGEGEWYISRSLIELIPGEQSPLLPPTARSPAKRPVPTYRHIIKLVFSAALLTLSGILLSSTTSSIADLLHIAQSTAGLTILSIATTLPEKLVAFKSGRKAQAGVLVANTVGSNVFLLTLVLGVVWTAQGHMPLTEMGAWIWVDVGIVLVSSILLFVIIWLNALKRWMGIVMFGVYVLYIISIFLR